MKSTKNQPVSFHYLRQEAQDGSPFGHSSYMVAMSDEALIFLNRDHPARWLTTRFNAAAKPHERVQALADGLRELDKSGHVADDLNGKILSHFLRRAIRHPISLAFAAGTVFGLGIGIAAHFLQ